ncbi:uncharacterized protein FIESC28_08496 [Fusarium coffeatum]|uniref:Uncharacterized protein n=1 Tax=Fusarium coffeatum TaxID=231269 RepID=A0A366R6M6_9HYPO|nr:uncharacterized protein FIESC28_08496 [Fusarium coffeatum]RBR12794.1 hypothetical protein FIESC28_08496 [Fusarium coffeatum]
MAPLPAGRDKIPAHDTLFTRDTLPEEYDAQYEKTYHEDSELLSTSKRGLNPLSPESLSNWAYDQLRGPYDNQPPPPGQPPDYWKHRRPALIYIPDHPPTHPPARQPPSSYDPGYPENPAYGRDNQPPRPAPGYDPGYSRDNLPPRPAPHYDPGYGRGQLPPRPPPPYEPGHPPAQQMPAIHDPHVDQTPGHVPPKPAAPSLAEKAGGVHNMVYIGGVIGAVVIIAGLILILKTWMEKRKEKKEAEGGGDGGGGDN